MSINISSYIIEVNFPVHDFREVNCWFENPTPRQYELIFEQKRNTSSNQNEKEDWAALAKFMKWADACNARKIKTSIRSTKNKLNIFLTFDNLCDLQKFVEGLK